MPRLCKAFYDSLLRTHLMKLSRSVLLHNPLGSMLLHDPILYLKRGQNQARGR